MDMTKVMQGMVILLTVMVVAMSSFAGTVQLPRTGQASSYGTNDDGALQKGVAWPSPRFTDNSNGTVIDNLTGLIWLKNANCLGVSWTAALKDVGSIANGQCGLTDGSTSGQWRVPNVRELESLVNAGQSNIAAWLNSQGFSSVQSGHYWTATTYAPSTDDAWYVNLSDGHIYWGKKAVSYYVWPVRSGK
jgi:hypothetical protein